MSQSRLIPLTYYDPGKEVRLTVYADTIILDRSGEGSVISAVRFGGYPEMVKAMSDAIYGGATLEMPLNGQTSQLKAIPKQYRRQMSHDGQYAVGTLMANDDPQAADSPDDDEDPEEAGEQQTIQPRKCYIFVPAGDRDRLFDELDRKTAAPLIPEFRDVVLDALIDRGELRPLEVFSLREKLDAWVLELRPNDENVVEILERGLECGAISIPGAVSDQPDGFEGVENITGYLNTFGVTVADRIRDQFTPLFDPASEPLSEEVLAVNDYIQQKAGYSLYDAQLAVAEAVKRSWTRRASRSSLPNVEVERRKSAPRPWALCMVCGQLKAGAGPKNPLGWSCAPPISPRSGFGRSVRPCQIPALWWSRASLNWSGCMKCTRPETRVFMRFSARKRPGTAICAIPPSLGMTASGRSSAPTAASPSRWSTATTAPVTWSMQTCNFSCGNIRKIVSAGSAAPCCGPRSIQAEISFGPKYRILAGSTSLSPPATSLSQKMT